MAQASYNAQMLSSDLNASAIREITRHMEYCLKLDDTYKGYSKSERETIEATMKGLNTILSWNEKRCGLCGQTKDKCYIACTQTYND